MIPNEPRFQRPSQSRTRKVVYTFFVLALITVGIGFAQTQRRSSAPPEVLSAATITLPIAATISTASSSAEKIDEYLTVDETLRDVNFCGTTYRAKQVFIDGIDVVQRIAELVTKGHFDYENEVCVRVETYRANGLLKNKNEMGVSITESVDAIGVVKKGPIYQLALGSPMGNFQPIGDFRIDTATRDITIILQTFDGAFENLIGKLK